MKKYKIEDIKLEYQEAKDRLELSEGHIAITEAWENMHRVTYGHFPSLLDALGAAEKRADNLEKMLSNIPYDVDEDKVLVYIPESEIIDEQAEKIKALERAIKTVELDYDDFSPACHTCINIATRYDDDGCHMTGSCFNYENWQFDQDRFTEKESFDETKNLHP